MPSSSKIHGRLSFLNLTAYLNHWAPHHPLIGEASSKSGTFFHYLGHGLTAEESTDKSGKEISRSNNDDAFIHQPTVPFKEIYCISSFCLTWFSASHRAWRSLSLVMVNGRYLKRLSLKFRTRNRGIRPISSGMYSRRLLRRERTVIPLQLPSFEEKKIQQIRNLFVIKYISYTS